MALACLTRNLKDRLSYFANWKFNFQKTRVIGSLRYLDEAMDRYSHAPFFAKFNRGSILYHAKGTGDHYGVAHALFYEEALFLNHVVRNWSFDTSKLSQYELEDYNRGVDKLKEWKKLDNLMKEIGHFGGEIKQIIYFRRNAHTPQQNMHWGYPDYEKDILKKYEQLNKDLEGFPEWQTKLEKDILPLIKLVSDQVTPTPDAIEDSPFKDFNRFVFFK